MPSNYPTALDDFANPAGGSTLANPPHHTQHGDVNDAVEAIEAELGLTPSGTSATVRARAEAIEAAAFGAGATFPAQPAYGNNRPFYRTDWGLFFYYDGTRWLTAQIFYQQLATVTVSATGVSHTPLALPRAESGSIWAMQYQALFSVAGGGSALSGSHKWVIQLNYTPADASFGSATIDSGASAGTQRNTAISTTGVLIPSGAINGYHFATKTGTPGDLTVTPAYWFRIMTT